MRAREEQDVVLPTLRLAFATAQCLDEIRSAAERRLPQGWSLTDIDAPEGTRMCLVSHEDDESGSGFLVSEGRAHVLELHALRDEALVLLGRRLAGGMAMLPSARAA